MNLETVTVTAFRYTTILLHFYLKKLLFKFFINYHYTDDEDSEKVLKIIKKNIEDLGKLCLRGHAVNMSIGSRQLNLRSVTP